MKFCSINSWEESCGVGRSVVATHGISTIVNQPDDLEDEPVSNRPSDLLLAYRLRMLLQTPTMQVEAHPTAR